MSNERLANESPFGPRPHLLPLASGPTRLEFSKGENLRAIVRTKNSMPFYRYFLMTNYPKLVPCADFCKSAEDLFDAPTLQKAQALTDRFLSKGSTEKVSAKEKSKSILEALATGVIPIRLIHEVQDMMYEKLLADHVYSEFIEQFPHYSNMIETLINQEKAKRALKGMKKQPNDEPYEPEREQRRTESKGIVESVTPTSTSSKSHHKQKIVCSHFHGKQSSPCEHCNHFLSDHVSMRNTQPLENTKPTEIVNLNRLRVSEYSTLGLTSSSLSNLVHKSSDEKITELLNECDEPNSLVSNSAELFHNNMTPTALPDQLTETLAFESSLRETNSSPALHKKSTISLSPNVCGVTQHKSSRKLQNERFESNYSTSPIEMAKRKARKRNSFSGPQIKVESKGNDERIDEKSEKQKKSHKKSSALDINEGEIGILDLFEASLLPKLAEYSLNFNEVSIDEISLGSGTASVIHKGLWRDQEVAIKFLKQPTNKVLIKDFQKELECLITMRSPYAVYFFGVIIEPIPCVLLEYCANGSLFDYMSNTANPFTISMIFMFFLDSARALRAMHGWCPPKVHRDVKSLNFMLTENLHLKISDFGLTRSCSEDELGSLMSVRGTYSFCPPELLNNVPYNEKSDIYSLGIVYWEMINRWLKGEYQKPYHDHVFEVDFQIIVEVGKGMRPTIPPKCPTELNELLELMWNPVVEKRPTAAEVVGFVDEIKSFNFLPNAKKWKKLSNLHELE